MQFPLFLPPRAETRETFYSPQTTGSEKRRLTFILYLAIMLYSVTAKYEMGGCTYMSDEFYQALVSPYRREIIKLLKWKNLSAGEIAEHFDISQPSVSRHLDVLKRAEIVTTERKANQIIYSLNLSVLDEMYIQLSDLLNKGSEKKAEYGKTEVSYENQ